MKKLRIGIVGLGLIAQLEHLPNLLKLNQLFEVVGAVDPSQKARTFFQARGVHTLADINQLWDLRPDAILIASPDPYHVEITLAALARGIHVFSEKPLCYSTDEARAIAAARDQSGCVVQVGYMKRFDPSYALLRSMLPKDGLGLRLINVEVQDPDAWPFSKHQGEVLVADDVAQPLIRESQQKRHEQITRALGGADVSRVIRGFAGPYASSLVHDINAVHGLLDAMQRKTGAVCGAAFFAAGEGGQGAVRIADTDALWQMTFVAVPKVAQYQERITLYFDDVVYTLEFPSPYLNHFPTRLTVSRSDGEHWTSTEHRSSYQEAFVLELQAFHAAVAGAGPVRNTVEHAEQDMRLIAELTQFAMQHAG